MEVPVQLEPLLNSLPIQNPAGNLNRCLSHWINLTKNNFIINIIRNGYSMQFSSPPVLYDSVISNPKSSVKVQALAGEIQKHVASGAISPVTPSDSQFVWRVFTVPKNQGGFRMIIDLKPLNTHITKAHFRMEDREYIKSLIAPDDFMVSIDLKDAFFAIPLHRDSKKYVVFEFDNQRYQYNVLPFGLSSSPRIFSKVIKSAIAFLRSRGLKISFYLDDIFIANSSFDDLLHNLHVTLELLSNLGYTINKKKSNFIPSKTLKHLGFQWDSASMIVALPQEKIFKMKRLASKLLFSSCTVRALASFIGLLVSFNFAFYFAPLYYRLLQFCLLDHLKAPHSWEDQVSLSVEARSEVEWWWKCSPTEISPSPLTEFKPEISLFCDASLSGWGSTLSTGESTSGSWSEQESDFHINGLELKAITLSLLSFSKLLRDRKVLIHSDNKTAVFYLNKMGGTHSRTLCSLALRTWEVLRENNILARAVYIPGMDNISADFNSRVKLLHEYSISVETFSLLESFLNFNCSVDLFASRLNRKCNLYVSWKPDPFAFKVDAFSFPWPSCPYMFPPIPMISRCLEKFLQDRVSLGLLLTPAWSTLPSLPLILESLVDDPIFIPSSHLLGSLPTRHPFDLMGWCISANSAASADYQKKLRMRCSRVFPNQLYVHTSDTGNSLLTGLGEKGINVRFLSP